MPYITAAVLWAKNLPFCAPVSALELKINLVYSNICLFYCYTVFAPLVLPRALYIIMYLSFMYNIVYVIHIKIMYIRIHVVLHAVECVQV